MWSPDGRQIAFASERDGGWEVYVMDADGSNQRQLTKDNVFSFLPAWSPDGTRIAFISARGTTWGVYIMDADGSNRRWLVDNAAYFRPAWRR
jgi:TolB protein